MFFFLSFPLSFRMENQERRMATSQPPRAGRSAAYSRIDGESIEMESERANDDVDDRFEFHNRTLSLGWTIGDPSSVDCRRCDRWNSTMDHSHRDRESNHQIAISFFSLCISPIRMWSWSWSFSMFCMAQHNTAKHRKNFAIQGRGTRDQDDAPESNSKTNVICMENRWQCDDVMAPPIHWLAFFGSGISMNAKRVVGRSTERSKRKTTTRRRQTNNKRSTTTKTMNEKTHSARCDQWRWRRDDEDDDNREWRKNPIDERTSNEHQYK